MVLTDLHAGEKAVIEDFERLELEAILTDMGCPRGTEVQVYRKSLFGGPVSIKTAGGSILALRTIDAQQLRISRP